MRCAHRPNEIRLVHSTFGATDDVRDLLAMINVQNRCRTPSPIGRNPSLAIQCKNCCMFDVVPAYSVNLRSIHRVRPQQRHVVELSGYVIG
jgi:hypothetical protein